MNHHFSPSAAKKYGVDCAIILNNIHHWCKDHESANTHLYDGRNWVFYSLTALSKIFPYFSPGKIRSTLAKMEESGLIVSGIYNDDKRDRTKWYAITELGKTVAHSDCHTFCVEVAVATSIPAAVLLKHFKFWCEKNAANKKNHKDGRFWTYNKTEAYAELFQYMTRKHVRTAIEKLLNLGWIVIGCFNRDGFDRTKWYSITDEGVLAANGSICQNRPMEKTKPANGVCKSGQTIPDLKHSDLKLPDHDIHSTTFLGTKKSVSASSRYFIDELDGGKFEKCHEMMSVFKRYKDAGYCKNLYDGNLTYEEWEQAEAAMERIDTDQIHAAFFKVYKERFERNPKYSRPGSVNILFLTMAYYDGGFDDMFPRISGMM